MNKLIVSIIVVTMLAIGGLIATSDSAYVDSHAGQDQFISSLLK